MRGKTLKRITVEYYESCFVRLNRFCKLRFEQALKGITEANRARFVEAADQVGQIGAKPREFVEAQFRFFDFVSDLKGRMILPMPHQLRGEKAVSRWVLHHSGEAFSESSAAALLRARKVTVGVSPSFFDPEVQIAEFFRDERKLANLSSILRLEEREVLRLHPKEFSRAFVCAMREAA